MFLGLDVGSVSVKAVLLDHKKQVVDYIYIRNRGIIESVIEVLIKFKNQDITACGVTGSGRDLAGCMIGADIIKTEVLAHSIATIHYYPQVGTIFEIGGEDCKLMQIKNGVLKHFSMNTICAGGTGSMIESIAGRMGINIEDVGHCAMMAEKNLDLPGKCGIFCQSAVINRLNSGYNKNDILMGVCRALIRNYLNICKGTELEPLFIFQGATAKNSALLIALADEINNSVLVPEYPEYMGAIGIALMASENPDGKTVFRGFDKIINSRYILNNLKCNDCPNNCDITQIFQGEKIIGCLGSRCGKYNG